MYSFQLFIVLGLLKCIKSFFHCSKPSIRLTKCKQSRDPTTDFLKEPSIPAVISTSNKALVGGIKDILSIYYGDRHYARFAALETIARVPYFAYTSVLHLYETLGWERRKEYIKLHFAESWNELHHLLIMESLGGNQEFGDRFISQHIAFFYYWVVVAAFMTVPAVAYNLNMHIEQHAFETYDSFLNEHEDELKQQPPPLIAVEYYETGDMSLFDMFHSNQLEGKSSVNKEMRRPKIKNLYDVFYNVREDEAEHAATMRILEGNTIQRRNKIS